MLPVKVVLVEQPESAFSTNMDPFPKLQMSGCSGREELRGGNIRSVWKTLFLKYVVGKHLEF